jgi:hypothetical protein
MHRDSIFNGFDGVLKEFAAYAPWPEAEEIEAEIRIEAAKATAECHRAWAKLGDRKKWKLLKKAMPLGDSIDVRAPTEPDDFMPPTFDNSCETTDDQSNPPSRTTFPVPSIMADPSDSEPSTNVKPAMRQRTIPTILFQSSGTA